MPKNLAWSQQKVDIVTIMSQVGVYAPAERAETFLLCPLSPSILLGFTCGRSRADEQPCWAACPLAGAGCPLERGPEPLPWCSRCGSALTAAAHNRCKRRHLNSSRNHGRIQRKTAGRRSSLSLNRKSPTSVGYGKNLKCQTTVFESPPFYFSKGQTLWVHKMRIFLASILKFVLFRR